MSGIVKFVVGVIGVGYNKFKLFSDFNYNVMFGIVYFDGLSDEF